MGEFLADPLRWVLHEGAFLAKDAISSLPFLVGLIELLLVGYLLDQMRLLLKRRRELELRLILTSRLLEQVQKTLDRIDSDFAATR